MGASLGGRQNGWRQKIEETHRIQSFDTVTANFLQRARDTALEVVAVGFSLTIDKKRMRKGTGQKIKQW